MGGIFINKYTSSGTADFDISSNAFYQQGSFWNPSGIHIINDTGTMNADIVNNTMIDSRWGIILRNGAGAIFTANIQSNLVAFGGIGFDFEASISVTNDYNLYYQNSLYVNYTPGAHAINADPKIMGMQNARLRAGSPALEGGNPVGLLLVADAPFIDADGLLRIKNSAATGGGVIDIGAYEAGDVAFNHKSSTNTSHVTAFDNMTTNNLSNLDNLHITSNWNPDGIGGIYNDDNEGLFYGSNDWRIFNQGFVNMATGASFNISKFAATANTFEHLVTASGANNSAINRAGLNGNLDKILQVSQHWTGVYNDHPPGIFYASGNWRIINFDLANIPQNSNFNVYYQGKSKSAYEHIARPANTVFNFTYLDNPIINGVHCAQIQVTQSASQGVFNDSPIGVFYDTSANKWAVFNQNIAINMPENAAFHVLINPAQIAECTDLIFKDGFE